MQCKCIYFFADDPARLAFLSASPRHVDFLDCKTETASVLRSFECEREAFSDS